MSDAVTSARRLMGRPTDVLPASSKLRRDAQRLRWFVTSFHRQVTVLTAETGIVFEIDDRMLARAFVTWLRGFEAHRAAADLDRRDFVHFAAGLMLRSMIRHLPVESVGMPASADLRNPAYFWPEGFACFAYCLNVCDAVLMQEFGDGVHIASDFDEVAVWWSFRENVLEDSRWAIPFFDKLSGHEPTWDAPDFFLARQRIQARLRLGRECARTLLPLPFADASAAEPSGSITRRAERRGREDGQRL